MLGQEPSNLPSQPGAELEKPPEISNHRYNPNSEPGLLGPVFASNWEILRRVPEFQAVAKQWVESKNFRFQHAGEQKVYKENQVARCALDWMLTPEDRYELAKFQMGNRLFFVEAELNYGPIIVKKHRERQTTDMANCIPYLFDVNPDPAPGGILTLNQTWPTTPAKFRAQFSSILGGNILEEVLLKEQGLTLSSLGNLLVGADPLTPDDQAALGRLLLLIGDKLQRLSGDYRILAIRRQVFYSERLIDEVLERIKKSLPVQARKGNDWDSRQGFLGTPDQWDKLLAWEAAEGNPYAAAADFLPKAPPGQAEPVQSAKRKTRSAQQRDMASSLERSVRAIQRWYPLIYPIRNLGAA